MFHCLFGCYVSLLGGQNKEGEKEKKQEGAHTEQEPGEKHHHSLQWIVNTLIPETWDKRCAVILTLMGLKNIKIFHIFKP